MKNYLSLIANGNASEAIKSYLREAELRDWMNEVDEDEIYKIINSPEFKLYLEILGL